jgi:methylated-DNA-protein-cysteine methyltransferase related protein
VGYAMAALKDTRTARDVPWHRVLGARPRNRAGVSIKDPVGGAIQRKLLEDEGVRFDARGNVSLDAFGWFGARVKAAVKAKAKVAKKAKAKVAKKVKPKVAAKVKRAGKAQVKRGVKGGRKL